MSQPEATLRQLRHELQMVVTDLDRAKQELTAERARTAALAARLIEASCRAATDQAAPPTPSAAELALQAEVAALLHHREEVRLLRASNSWRVTRPLRALGRPAEVVRTLLRRLR